MIKTHTEFIDKIDGLTEGKIRARHPEMVMDIEEYVDRIKNVQKERMKRSLGMEKINRAGMII